MNVPVAAPQGRLAGAFALWGGPAAWFAQLNLGYAWASRPCFPHTQRLLAPLPGTPWTGGALALLLVVCVLIALAAFWVAWQRYQLTAAEPQAGGAHDPRARLCFLSLWGVAFGGGFALVTLANAVALLLLPRCAG
ncbi:MAG: hypothetical protein JOZ03_14100 [Gammaproteobacteria bacterium]|nr:hypothetical protein [Gammaproteobacteria bacterium]